MSAPVWHSRLTPLAFLERTALAFPTRTAVVDGERRLTWAELRERVRRLGRRASERRHRARRPRRVSGAERARAARGALRRPGRGRSPGRNQHAFDAGGGRLHPRSLGRAVPRRARVAAPPGRGRDRRARPRLRRRSTRRSSRRPATASPRTGSRARTTRSRSTTRAAPRAGRRASCSATAAPHLNALAELVHARLTPRSVYLWTLPMFHCNGWCFTWAVTAAGASHVCLPSVDPPRSGG